VGGAEYLRAWFHDEYHRLNPSNWDGTTVTERARSSGFRINLTISHAGRALRFQPITIQISFNGFNLIDFFVDVFHHDTSAPRALSLFYVEYLRLAASLQR